MTKQIPLSQGKFAIVDDEDFEFLMQWKWYYTHGYARRTKYLGINPITNKQVSQPIYLHRELIPSSQNMLVDHINMDKLDNRRSNLRLSTKSQNGMNRAGENNSSSKYKGVSWFKRDKNWTAQIVYNGKNKRIGYFDTEEEAAKAYNKYASQHFGEYAYLNPIE